MARIRRRSDASPPTTPVVLPAPGLVTADETTGRYLVLLREDHADRAVATLKEKVGLRAVASAADYRAGAINMEEAGDSDVIVFDKVKVAVVKADPSQASALSVAAAEDSAILAVERERILYHCAVLQPTGGGGGPSPFEYLRGYRDAVNHLYEQLTGGPAVAEAGAAAVVFNDSATSTWGLQATRTIESHFSGRGVAVAILDTGLDLQHPDFAGRDITSQSFIDGQQVQDGHGHGTHTAGTSCGSMHAGTRRYGCAYATNIFIGKVLSNQGSGPDASIIAGINWAITNRCRIVSMSLGSPVQPGQPFSQVYENLGRRALAAGTLIIAAAGNDSQRPDHIAPVGHPANCPSIMAVAAVDNRLGIAPFSNGGINPDGGGVDLAGPGVNVYSSWPMPTRYRTISGTSMATPHVSGIAALWLEARGLNTTAQALWQLLVANARRLPLPARDVGTGLAQAPVDDR